MTCHGCLKDIRSGEFCPRCRKELFDGIAVSGGLPFSKPEFNAIRRDMSGRLSISGVQSKISLTIQEKHFSTVSSQGTYILKPSAAHYGMPYGNTMSENEHLTMQIARQVFSIQTAPCALVYFPDGERAYITRRFDRVGDRKLQQEDFCQLANQSEDTHGKNYKYDSSYEAVGRVLKQYCPSYKVEAVKLFSLILFSYIVSNGDLHLKNFSLLESEYGDFLLSPAYDLMNTTLHIPDEKRTALEMFDTYESAFFSANGFYGSDDFKHLASLYGIAASLSEKILNEFVSKEDAIAQIVEVSFLPDDAKAIYLDLVKDRISALKLK